MRRSKATWLVAILLCGCASPRQSVYVDLGKVVLPAQLESDLTHNSGPVSPPTRTDTIAIDPTPIRTIDHKALRQKEAALLARMESIRKRSVTRLREELFNIYTKQVERRRAAKETELRQEFLRLLETAHEKVSAAFDAYTQERWPILTELALLVGFPIPPREKIEPPSSEAKWERKQYDRAISLFAELDRVKAEYDAKVISFHDEARAQIAQRRVTEGVNLANELDRLGVQAAELAELAVRGADNATDLVLDEQPKFVLKALSGDRASISVNAPTFPNLESAGTTSPRDIISRREKIEALLKIWADSSGFKIVNNPKMGLDQTQRFQEWIEQRVAGH